MRDDQDEKRTIEARLLRVGTVVVDLRYSRLTRDGREVPLPPRAFDLLALFLSRPGVLLSREEIFRLVWKNVLVEDANLTQTVWLLRRALGDEGKAWICTVSKRGYVFEGPPVEVADAAASEPDDAETSATVEPLEPPVAPLAPEPDAATPGRVRGRTARLAAAVIVVVLAVLLALLAADWLAWSPPASAPDVAGRIIVINALDEGGSEAAHLAVSLAREWIVWQLGDLHLRDIVSVDSGLEIGATGGSDRALLLSARATGDPSRMRVDAHLAGPGAGGRWQAEGAVDDLPRMVGELAQQVVRGIVPDASASKDVTFELSLDTARRYGAALDARGAGNGTKQLRELEDVVRREPQFDLARLQLARYLSDLGRIAEAREHMTALSAWIARLPPGARRLLGAQHAEIAGDVDEAVREYAALAQAYPQQPRFRFDTARNLLNADRAGDALRLLDDVVLDRRGGYLQARWLLLRAEAQLATGALQAASASARHARQIAAQSGVRQDGVEAQAAVVAAIADAQNSGSPIDLAALREAALSLDGTGDELRALHTRVVAALLDTASSATQARAVVNALLAKAQAAGNIGLEVQMLRELARLASRGGDFATYRKRLEEAHAAASAAGDRVQQRRVDAELIHDDLLRGDYAAARRRGEPWRDDSLLSAAAIDFAIQVARLAIDVGDFPAALTQLALLEKAKRHDRDATTPTALSARLACVRAAVQLRQGVLEEAQRSYTACAGAPAAADRQTARIGLAVVALVSGESADDDARSRIDALTPIALLNAGVGAMRSVDIVPLLPPHGRRDEARRLFDAELNDALRGGFHRREWTARLHLAALALVERRVDDAAEGVRKARALMPDDAWIDVAAARLLTAAIALVRGDEAAAWPVLAALSQEALVRGDVVVLLQAQSLAGDRLDAIGGSKQAHDALIALSGMRGVSCRWLLDGAAKR